MVTFNTKSSRYETTCDLDLSPIYSKVKKIIGLYIAGEMSNSASNTEFYYYSSCLVLSAPFTIPATGSASISTFFCSTNSVIDPSYADTAILVPNYSSSSHMIIKMGKWAHRMDYNKVITLYSAWLMYQ